MKWPQVEAESIGFAGTIDSLTALPTSSSFKLRDSNWRNVGKCRRQGLDQVTKRQDFAKDDETLSSKTVRDCFRKDPGFDSGHTIIQIQE